jgi:hypothetical protein
VAAEGAVRGKANAIDARSTIHHALQIRRRRVHHIKERLLHATQDIRRAIDISITVTINHHCVQEHLLIHRRAPLRRVG